MTDEKKPMSLAEALAGVRERVSARGRQPSGAETMSAITNVRAMPSQAARWKRVVETASYRSTNAFMCDGTDLYADLLEALGPAARAAGVPLRDYVREVLVHILRREHRAETQSEIGTSTAIVNESEGIDEHLKQPGDSQ